MLSQGQSKEHDFFMTQKEKKELLQQWANHEFNKHKRIISALTKIKVMMPTLYGPEVVVPEYLIEEVLLAVLELEASVEALKPDKGD